MNKYKVALFACAFVWGFGYVAMDHLITTSSPMMAIALRFIGAALIMYIVSFTTINKTMLKNITPSLILGVVLFVAFLFQTYGLTLTSTSKNAFLTATNVIWTPIIVSIFYKYKVSKNVIIGCALMVVGVGFVSLDGLSKFNLGDILTLIGAFFFAIHIIFINKFARKGNVDSLVFGQLLTTGILALISTLIIGQNTIVLGREFIISFLFVIIFSTALCFYLQNYGLSHVESSQGAIILSLESMFGVIAAMIIDHERVNLITLVGFLIMFSAILIAEKGGNNEFQS